MKLSVFTMIEGDKEISGRKSLTKTNGYYGSSSKQAAHGTVNQSHLMPAVQAEIALALHTTACAKKHSVVID